MTIDDIFTAAIEGNLTKLEKYLRSGKVDINQMVDIGVQDGMHGWCPMLFSVLVHMSQNGVNPQVLDMLARYGVNCNASVHMENEKVRMDVPLLAYALQDWNNPDIVSYLLAYGANSNGEKVMYHPSGNACRFPMLYFALCNHSDKALSIMELLLQHGASPNELAVVYDENGGFYQYLPMIYFALVEENSMSKCISLFRHGAALKDVIDVGYGDVRRVEFRTYVEYLHPHLLPMLDSCYHGAMSAGMSRASHAGTAAAGSAGYAAQPSVQQNDAINSFKPQVTQAAAAPAHNVPVSAQTAPRPKPAVQRDVSGMRCYGKFRAYLFGNFGILAIAFGILAPLVMKDPDLKGGMFFIGLLCAGVCALLWLGVNRKAKKRGLHQMSVFWQFVLDSFLMFVKVLLCMTVVLIPLVSSITSNIQWEEKQTTSGRTVRVKKTGEGQYEDSLGNRYTS